MSRFTRLLGTSCVLAAAVAAGPAAADQLMGFNGFADGTYTHTTFKSCDGCESWGTAKIGIGMALPLADIPNMNWQVDASYQHEWNSGDNNNDDYCDYGDYEDYCSSEGNDHSAETWNFGLSPFWAGPMSRFGVNLNYQTTTHLGHVTNGGGFMEWYLNDAVTLSIKGGYLASGGSEQGGHGHYLSGAATFYGTPDLAVTAKVLWTDLVTGFGCAFGRPCISADLGYYGFGLDAEYMPVEDIGAAIFAGFIYKQFIVPGKDFETSTFHAGLRYYTGVAGGSLQNRHRNGNLAPFLRGADWNNIRSY